MEIVVKNPNAARCDLSIHKVQALHVKKLNTAWSLQVFSPWSTLIGHHSQCQTYSNYQNIVQHCHNIVYWYFIIWINPVTIINCTTWHVSICMTLIHHQGCCQREALPKKVLKKSHWHFLILCLKKNNLKLLIISSFLGIVCVCCNLKTLYFPPL